LGDFVLKKFVLLLSVPLALSACGGTKELPTQELRDMKPACAAGDMSVCSDIGHTIRRQRAEAAYQGVPTE